MSPNTEETYTTIPIDLSNIALSGYLTMSADLIARYMHDIWAKDMIDNGWKYGTTFDENNKEHPYLKPYNELSIERRNHERNKIIQVLKATIYLGYTIN